MYKSSSLGFAIVYYQFNCLFSLTLHVSRASNCLNICSNISIPNYHDAVYLSSLSVVGLIIEMPEQYVEYLDRDINNNRRELLNMNIFMQK